MYLPAVIQMWSTFHMLRSWCLFLNLTFGNADRAKGATQVVSKRKEHRLTNTKGTSYRMLNLFLEPLKDFSSVKISWHYCLLYVEKSLPLWIPCFSVKSRFITGWQLQPRWLSQTFSLMNYTLTRTKPQTRLYHLKGRSPRPKNSLQFPPKRAKKRNRRRGGKRE